MDACTCAVPEPTRHFVRQPTGALHLTAPAATWKPGAGYSRPDRAPW
jgi:hypothetical protein